MNSAGQECRWVLFGSLGGKIVDNFPMGTIQAKKIQLIGTTLKSRSNEYKTKLIKELGEIVFTQGEPIIDCVFKMSEASQAHEYLEKNTSIGKVLLKADLD